MHFENDAGYRHPGLGDAHLSLRWETRTHWPLLREAIPGLSETGAACVQALWSERATVGRAISYSRRNGKYSGRENVLWNGRAIVEAMDLLEERGLIDHFRQKPGGLGRQSTATATDDLMSVVRQALGPRPRLVPLMPRDPVVLRDASGCDIALPRTEECRRLAKGVDPINEAMTSIHLSGGAGAGYRRIFNVSMGRGGRLSAQGLSWQNMPKGVRQALRIDGEALRELDYKSQHPTMLYDAAGLPMPCDAYEIPIRPKNTPWPRKLAKVGMLILLNARTWHSAVGALAEDDAMRLLEIRPRSAEARKAAASLIDDIKTVHDPIRNAFHSDAGATLMRRDSDLAVDVLKRLRKTGDVALCVHDSFLIRRSREGVLHEAMLAAAHEAGLPNLQVEAA